jgi:hypothetical protein
MGIKRGKKGGNCVRGKTKYWLKKTKIVWIPFLLWFIFALVLMVAINYWTSMPDGEFSKAEDVVTEKFSTRKLENLSVYSKGLDIELGMSDTRRDIAISVIGGSDNGGEVFCELVKDTLVVEARKLKKRAKLRIILPQSKLNLTEIKTDFANLDIRDFRAGSITIDMTGYDARLEKVKTDRLEIQGQQTNLRLKNNLIGSAYLDSPSGNFDFRDNAIELLRAECGGSAFLYDRLWYGQWYVHAGRDIDAISRWIPYNTMLELRNYGRGDVGVLYQGKWQEATVLENTTKSYLAIRGRPKNNLTLISEEGKILIEKRMRKTVIPAFDEN